MEILGRGKIRASYPSGRVIETTGTLILDKVQSRKDDVVLIEPEKRKMALMVLDPRAIVTVDGVIRYHPRSLGVVHCVEMAEWLKEHSEWAANPPLL